MDSKAKCARAKGRLFDASIIFLLLPLYLDLVIFNTKLLFRKSATVAIRSTTAVSK